MRKKNIKYLIKKRILLKRSCHFIDRSRNADTVVLILAGYKPFLWDIVFERIHTFAPQDADICIVSSGVMSPELEKISTNYGWSYLATRKNNVCIALNVAIMHFPKAQYIYKIDEDIFVTKNFFSNTMKTIVETDKANSLYRDPIFVAPLIPINGFCHVPLLKYLNLEKEYALRFEPLHIGGKVMIASDEGAAKFMWGEGGYVPQIDDLDEIVSNNNEVIHCPIHFSIGAILLKRKMWEKIGYFTGYRGNGMGADEMQLCKSAVIWSYPMLITANTCVGHLSFGGQNEAMKKYFTENKNLFKIKNKTN